MSNPLVQPFHTPFQLPPFSQIKNEDFIPAIQALIEATRLEISKIINNTNEPDFENTIHQLERSGEQLGLISALLFNLNSAETSDELQKVAQEASQFLTDFDNEIKQNSQLFDRINHVYQKRAHTDLNQEQLMLLDKTWKSFVRSGASLKGSEKERFKQISLELASLQLKFEENVLAETNEFMLIVDSASDLAGLPDHVIARAAEAARKKGHDGKWIFTLHAPSFSPFMEFAENRELRKQMFMAYMSKAAKPNEHDNRPVIKKIIKLRAELANLLGYPNYASYVLAERMAETPENVLNFLFDLLAKAKQKAELDIEEVQTYLKDNHVTHELERWDLSFYMEKIRRFKYQFDDEELRQYFRLEDVLDGVFKTTEKLYGLTYKLNTELPKYHPDVRVYEVFENEQLKAILMADFFPREGKRPGAWMTSYRDQRQDNNGRRIPHISIVCNFTPSSADKPSLLKFDEVLTLYHEFGHALHGMLADTQYASLAGTHVYWDFVELPSQIFENWCYEKECLDLFAKHYESGNPISQDLIEKLKQSLTIQQGYTTLRQISFSLLDMAYHTLSVDQAAALDDLEEFEQRAMAPTAILPPVSGANMSTHFGHIFAGGYAAGYYSYKWAEVLDADAFELFKQQGVFNPVVATSFKKTILSKGGTIPPMELYRKFRGNKPDPNALLRRVGLS